MDSETIVRRLYDQCLNGRDMDVIDQLVADDFLDHGAIPGQGPGRSGLKDRIALFATGFSDQKLTVEDLVADEELVAVRITSTGTHTGNLMGMPGSGKSFQIEGMDFYRVCDGKIVEHWAQYDTGSLMRQIGIA